MTPWERAIDFTLRYEGGYANSPADNGGETFRGISRKFHAEWEGWPDVDRVKAAFPSEFKDLLAKDHDLMQKAIFFYRKNYWDAVHGDELPGKLAVAAFDMAVHSGARTAVRILQYVVGAHVDGIVGPKTVKACFDAGESGVVGYLAARAKLLHDIMADKPDQRVWALNWFKRLFKLANVVLDGGGVDFAAQN